MTALLPTADLDETLGALFRHDEGVQYAASDGRGGRAAICRGLARRHDLSRVSPATTFHCFSTTKPVTAIAILQLAEAGQLSLDDPLVRHLPELPYGEGATIRHALSHQAGIPSPFPLSWVHADDEHTSFDALAFYQSAIAAHPRASAPGRRSRYSNLGFLVLGRIIEVCSGLRYEQYVEERILDALLPAPRGEAYLGFAIPRDRHAVGYTRLASWVGLFTALMPDPPKLRSREGSYLRYRPFHLDGAAYGGLKGNALGWAAVLEAIATRDPRLLESASFDALFSPQPLQDGKPSGHALSFMTGRLGGVGYVCHAGGGPGYCAEVRVYPDLGAWSVLLTNTTVVHDARMLDRVDARWVSRR